jgi:hypothetical protein
MPRSNHWARYLFGLVLGLIACVCWPVSQAADIELSANQPSHRRLAQAELPGQELPRDAEHWRRALGASPKALRAQHAAQVAAATADSQGIDFWLTFPANQGQPTLSLFITGNTNTTGTVTIPGLGFTAPFTVTTGTVTTVTLPSMAVLDSSAVEPIENKGIDVTPLNEVAVYGLNRIPATTDAYLGLPTDILGTEYIVLAYQNTTTNGTQFTVVATADDTTVTIIPSVSTGAAPHRGPVYDRAGAGADLSAQEHWRRE